MEKPYADAYALQNYNRYQKMDIPNWKSSDFTSNWNKGVVLTGQWHQTYQFQLHILKCYENSVLQHGWKSQHAITKSCLSTR